MNDNLLYCIDEFLSDHGYKSKLYLDRYLIFNDYDKLNYEEILSGLSLSYSIQEIPIKDKIIIFYNDDFYYVISDNNIRSLKNLKHRIKNFNIDCAYVLNLDGNDFSLLRTWDVEYLKIKKKSLFQGTFINTAGMFVCVAIIGMLDIVIAYFLRMLIDYYIYLNKIEHLKIIYFGIFFIIFLEYILKKIYQQIKKNKSKKIVTSLTGIYEYEDSKDLIINIAVSFIFSLYLVIVYKDIFILYLISLIILCSLLLFKGLFLSTLTINGDSVKKSILDFISVGIELFVICLIILYGNYLNMNHTLTSGTILMSLYLCLKCLLLALTALFKVDHVIFNNRLLKKAIYNMIDAKDKEHQFKLYNIHELKIVNLTYRSFKKSNFDNFNFEAKKNDVIIFKGNDIYIQKILCDLLRGRKTVEAEKIFFDNIDIVNITNEDRENIVKVYGDFDIKEGETFLHYLTSGKDYEVDELIKLCHLFGFGFSEFINGIYTDYYKGYLDVLVHNAICYKMVIIKSLLSDADIIVLCDVVSKLLLCDQEDTMKILKRSDKIVILFENYLIC